jgi:transposase
MRFYTQQHPYYCGIDLHARTMYMCILDHAGAIVLHRNMKADPDSFVKAVAPYRDRMVVAVECIFTWYWLADVCAREKIAFVLGHALYMKAIHGGKAKNDKIDAYKIAVLLRGGMIAQAYVYPQEMRSTRDLLRRRMKLMQQRAQLLAHIQNTNSQYNLPVIEEQISYKSNRAGIAERFTDSSVRANIGLDLKRIDFYDGLLREVEQEILRQAKQHDAKTLELLDSVPGVGKILSLVLLYEIHDIGRFASVQDFSSYCRLVKSKKESAGKTYGYSGAKMGNATLKWAFSEAAVLFLCNNPSAQADLARQAKIHGKGKALTMLAHKLGRAVYYMLQRGETFDMKRFLNR